METPPVPKPRTGIVPQNDPNKKPVPLPRTKVPANNDKVSATDILRSIGTVSKQITEDVVQKVSSSAKSANEKLEKSLIDGSKFAKGTLEKTLSTSKAVRDSVTKSVIEGTRSAGLKLRVPRRTDNNNEVPQRCASMPPVDVSFFDNIQFHSPLLEQKKYVDDTQSNVVPSLSLNAHFDDLCLHSNNSDSNTDTISNFSYEDSKESDTNDASNVQSSHEQLTYDTPKSSRTNSIISSMSTPEVPERRKKRESAIDIMRQNSLYENWTLPPPSKSIPITPTSEEPRSRPSNSTIYEFDPLNSTSTTQKYEGVSNELILLESFLIGDTYGSIISTDNNDDYSDSDRDTEYFNPPTPPERSDSLFLTDDTPTTSSNNRDTNSNWYIDKDGGVKANTEEVKVTNSVMQRFSHILKLDTKLHKSTKPIPQAVEVIDRPPINNKIAPYFCGMLTKVSSAMGEDLFKNSPPSRYCVLSEQKLICYTDPTNCIVKESYGLDSIYSIQIVLPLSSSTTSNSYCFELLVSSGTRHSARKVVFSCSSASERRNWSQKIVEHLTYGFPTKYTAEYTRCGWCFLKEGVSGEWRGAWVMLLRRVLVYYTTKDPTVLTVDLRKTRCVVTQNPDEETKIACPTDGSGNLLLDCPHATLYLRFPHERELKGWRYIIKLAAHNNGAQIHHQQLTKEDVPTIVEKCISFIYAHGSLSEGIYRRAGSSGVLTELLGRFRRDAWSVQLSPSEHSEHDVAGVLKRFFRDLPESLVPQDKHQALTAALDIKDDTERYTEYQRIMSTMPLVARNTARKLFAHLNLLTTLSDANKMNAENLAAVWAPTIMPAALTSNTLQTAWSSKEVFVIRDLIANFEAIWQPTEAEKRREAAVRRVLLAVLGNIKLAPKKAAGDLKAWVYVKDRNVCHQITLTPNKTCSDVCIELCEKAQMDSHLLMLEEVVCNESMRRIVHIDEVVLDVVLRWGYWDEEDRKDNYLVITENKLLYEMESLSRSLTLVCGELKIANETTKTFKPHVFEIHDGVLCYYKDKQGSHKIEEWRSKEILWYMGHEPKRNPQARWTITFIPKNNKQKRSKERPWFGCTIAGSMLKDQIRWMTALMFGEHKNVLPTPRLVVT